MDIGLSIAASALSATEQGVSIYANDLANANTVAFQPAVPLFGGSSAAISPKSAAAGSVPAAAPSVSVGTGVYLSEADTASSAATLVRTGVPTDVAISGQGYFAVSTPAGPKYTRDGGFSFDASGNLVTSQGYMVLSAQGSPIQVDPSQAQSAGIGPSGVIQAGGQQVATLGIATFPNPAGLLPAGGSAFAAGPDSGPATLGAAPVGTSLTPGSLEGSGTDVAQSLTGLITLERSFQLATVAAKDASQMLGWAAGLG